MKACPCLCVKAARVGALAYRSLPAVAVDGHVHSAFNHAVNVRYGDGGWFCLHDRDRALHPYSVVIDAGAFPSVEPGQPVGVSRRWIEFPESGIEVDIGHAPVWDSRLRPFGESLDLCPAELSDRKILDRHLHRAAGILWKLGAERETASLFLSALSGSKAGPPGEVGSRDFFRAKAVELIGQFMQSWIDGRNDLAGTVASRLVGFGPGLTPSGDDLLLGVLGAHHCFSRASGDAYRHAGFVRVICGRLPGLLCSTAIQSRLMLEAALAGHYPAPVSGLLASIGRGGEDGMLESVARLRNVGATSGEDVLAGILLWLKTRERCERS